MKEHTSPIRTYIRVFAALIILAGITAGVSEINLGPFNVTVALAIALVKAGLVALFFMHVLEARRVIGLVIFASIVWLSILLILTSADYATRSWTTLPGGL